MGFTTSYLHTGDTVIFVNYVDDGKNNHLKTMEHVHVWNGLSNYYMCQVSPNQLSLTARKLSSDYQVRTVICTSTF